MSSPYQKEILEQVLDGKTHWSNAEVDGDFDVFKTQVVVPLRELKYEGIIDQLEEVEAAIDGEVHIVVVEILGAINYHHEED
jgi:hypothetical protein